MRARLVGLALALSLALAEAAAPSLLSLGLVLSAASAASAQADDADAAAPLDTDEAAEEVAAAGDFEEADAAEEAAEAAEEEASAPAPAPEPEPEPAPPPKFEPPPTASPAVVRTWVEAAKKALPAAAVAASGLLLVSRIGGGLSSGDGGKVYKVPRAVRKAGAPAAVPDSATAEEEAPSDGPPAASGTWLDRQIDRAFYWLSQRFGKK
ncbi:hypothetical protein EMIHUDRAFT_441857 [Emiliania huxleyi CCMP1516]|uniref:Uncharacterized protein n=3 Tax=Emiliania huxleyi TaxID=2903 RepID=A0A0D3KA76_EMIH1|nr:hypothetical protein EMIHUDRAFT_422781 [Emiliania huxleyi CCMP1516]XP_005785090.1 hypothetical protein EMIHUDRAFT_441857 [Emiliania huxleyi CCMP1516]EOD04558.1 hypothetical protein EMIHUDRAFT_422781 [Emiliania huxleyi CCMP1516]EOD32661.1 hypothetical protein EMIHUDRAFT_441857 [Emiliania huxleyi CCMP1516]|eukprot:XP_005756987.1 hypothetical protein EMIHUDRAFT_422781 [Emiliania huxleyi CCMP1516]